MTWVKYLLDSLVILKAAILIMISLCAIRWYIKSELQSFTVITALLASCVIVAGELFFRYTSRPVVYRFFLNAMSHWIVFYCLTIMLGFARKNDAAKFKYPIRLIAFIPIHVLYAASIVIGLTWTDMVICDGKTRQIYPRIFYFQYGLFYLTYILFLFLRCKGYFLEWHTDINIISVDNKSGSEK